MSHETSSKHASSIKHQAIRLLHIGAQLSQNAGGKLHRISHSPQAVLVSWWEVLPGMVKPPTSSKRTKTQRCKKNVKKMFGNDKHLKNLPTEFVFPLSLLFVRNVSPISHISVSRMAVAKVFLPRIHFEKQTYQLLVCRHTPVGS